MRLWHNHVLLIWELGEAQLTADAASTTTIMPFVRVASQAEEEEHRTAKAELAAERAIVAFMVVLSRGTRMSSSRTARSSSPRRTLSRSNTIVARLPTSRQSTRRCLLSSPTRRMRRMKCLGVSPSPMTMRPIPRPGEGGYSPSPPTQTSPIRGRRGVDLLFYIY